MKIFSNGALNIYYEMYSFFKKTFWSPILDQESINLESRMNSWELLHLLYNTHFLLWMFFWRVLLSKGAIICTSWIEFLMKKKNQTLLWIELDALWGALKLQCSDVKKVKLASASWSSKRRRLRKFGARVIYKLRFFDVWFSFVFVNFVASC